MNKQDVQDLNMFQNFLEQTGELTPKKKVNYKSIEIDGVCASDYPDYVDAFVSYAEYEDGTELNEQELEELTNTGIAQEIAGEDGPCGMDHDFDIER